MRILFLGMFLSTMLWASHIEEYDVNKGNFIIFIPTITSNKMIVALHGSGERAINFVQNWTKEAQARHYYVVAPNSTDPNGWSGEDMNRIMKIVATAQSTYSIKRTLLSGASSGGQVALLLGINEYPYFNAVQTFMGLAITEMGKFIKFQSVAKNRRPILLIHGLKDAMIPIKFAQMNRDFLKSKNYAITYWEEPNMIHENYRQDNNKILDWFEKLR